MEPNGVNQDSISEPSTGDLSAPLDVQDIPRGNMDDDTSSTKIPFASTPRGWGMDETNWGGAFQPVTLRILLDQPQEEVPWVIEGYVAQGRLTILAGPPKLGKTTLSYELVGKVAMGQQFLGRPIRGGKVLVLGLEEHYQDISNRLRGLGGELFGDQVILQFAPLPYSEPILNQIEDYVRQHNIRFVLLDTLPAWWSLRDENDAAEVMRNCKPLLKCVRNTDAGWLAVVHTRKGGGQHGEEVRGSSVLLGAVDIAVMMKRERSGPRRLLSAVSRFDETPREMTVEYQDKTYVCLGDSGAALSAERAEKVFNALSDEGQTIDEIARKTEMSTQAVKRCITALDVRAKQEGAGVRGAPHRYSRNSIPPQAEP